MEIAEIVGRVDIFSSLPDKDRRVLAAAGVPRQFQAGHTVCKEGDRGTTFYAVGSGQLEVHAGVPPMIVDRIGPGSYFGEMSLLTGMPRTATIKAATACELVELDRPVFMRLFASNIALADTVSRAIVARNQNRTRKLAIRPDAPAPARADAASEHADLFSRIKKVFGLG